MGELLLHSYLLGVHIPLSNRAILRTGQEQVVFFWVPLTIIDTRYVALRVCHIEQVHVTPDSCLFPDAFRIVNLSLVISAAAKKMSSTRIERQCPHRMPIERFKVFERLQVSIHGREVPYLHPVIQTA